MLFIFIYSTFPFILFIIIIIINIQYYYYYCYYYYYRTFTDPRPSEREILDAVSSLSCNIIKSLKLGLIRCCSFNVCVCRDVFNFLFNNNGNRVVRKPGKMFNRCDFSDKYFNDGDFVYINNHNESIRVVFPVYMYSYVKFVKLGNGSF